MVTCSSAVWAPFFPVVLNISREGALTWEVNGRTAKIGYSGTAAIDVAATQAANTTNAGDTIAIVELSFTDPNAKAADVLKVGDTSLSLMVEPVPIKATY